MSRARGPEMPYRSLLHAQLIMPDQTHTVTHRNVPVCLGMSGSPSETLIHTPQLPIILGFPWSTRLLENQQSQGGEV